MLGDSSFTLLREIGALRLTPEEEIRFSIDAYRGYRYVSIRRYVQMDGLFVATRDGLTMTPEIVRLLAPKVLALPAPLTDGVLGKFAKRAGTCVVAAVKSVKGKPVLSLRQWQDDTGWTQKGIVLPLDKIAEVKELFRLTQEALEERPADDF